MEAQMVQAVGTIASPVAMVAVMIYMMRQFGGRLDGIGNRIDRLDARLSERIDKLDGRLDGRLSERIDKLDARVSDGIDKLDARLSQRIDRVDSRIEGLQEDHKNLATQLSELRGSLET